MAILERDTQVAKLRDHLAHAAAGQGRAGQGRIVFLSGESGSGKTTLIEPFVASLREDVPASILSCDGLKMLVRSGRCSTSPPPSDPRCNRCSPARSRVPSCSEL